MIAHTLRSTLAAPSTPARASPSQLRFASSSSSSSAPPPTSNATRSTVPPRSTHATYHPKGYGVSEGLKRARRPYLVKNIVTGSLIMGFAVGVYLYSISKVKQDDFSDLAEVRAPATAADQPQANGTANGHKV
ncbi:uncharacterized protein PFL1_02107 [Pseudozyma flocculosa PF-1]|uniref:Cytochrome c oxidase assembly factor 3 n=1 Tax=Pseudozyma flocculosa TaxID=84751 RepID=A0A5C3EZM0_9BASI|nr:uncharacterized protein PFL1_02107 [Pseudozyma flocculosa PF-1]EPQ30583.1 hypothetical protein PFL1_02107 [Pseudozyma flocculosa PF-1]SPO37678.1 uncharacterized protein PSFLO_03154 [Pseudozyma flocculosa]